MERQGPTCRFAFTLSFIDSGGSLNRRGIAACFSRSAADFLTTGGDHHDHLPTFKLGKLLDHDGVCEFVADAIEQSKPQLLMGDFTPAETQCDLALVAIFQKATDVAHLDVIVTVICAGAKLDFLDFDDLLLGLGFRCLLLFLVLELAVVHQPAHGRAGHGGNLHQINVQFTREFQRFLDADDAQGFVVGAVEANFGGRDLTVEPVCTLFTLAAVAKVGSDGDVPSNGAQGRWSGNDFTTYRRLSSATRGDVHQHPLGSGFQRHDAQIFVAPGPNSHGASSLFLVAHHKDVRQLLQRMLAYFIGDFLVA